MRTPTLEIFGQPEIFKGKNQWLGRIAKLERPPFSGKIARGSRQNLHNRSGDPLNLAAIDSDLIGCRTGLDQSFFERGSRGNIEYLRQHIGTCLIVRTAAQFSYPPKLRSGISVNIYHVNISR